jgi:hypothetical protein
MKNINILNKINYLKNINRQEDCIQSEELTEDEQLMLQEILEAHRDTFQKQEEKTPSRVPEIKTNVQ